MGKATWKSFHNVTTDFLGNRQSENYRDVVTDLVRSPWTRLRACRTTLHAMMSYLDLMLLRVFLMVRLSSAKSLNLFITRVGILILATPR